VTDSFPRRHARTRRFTLGQPRTFALSPDGARVAFLRSGGGEDPVHALWVLDTATGHERRIADPGELAGEGDPAALTAEERARRERLRESAEGIVAYAADRELRRAAFTLAGGLWLADLIEGGVQAVASPAGAFDPRLDRAGERIAYVRDGGVEVIAAHGGAPQVLVSPQAGETTVSWGSAEFIAAEEMGRLRGHWWAPDGARLAIARVDTAPVARWHIGDPANPDRAPQEIAYPAAGTPNALVSLHVVDLDGARTPVEWDLGQFPYLAAVRWDEHGPLLLTVQSRDQRRVAALAADPDTGTTSLVREWRDEHWVDLHPGLPRWLPDGRLLHADLAADTVVLAADGVPLTPAGLQLRHVAGVGADAVIIVAAAEPTAAQLWRVPLDGGDLQALTPAGDVADGAAAGDAVLTVRRKLEHAGMRAAVQIGGRSVPIAGDPAPHGLELRVQLLTLGPRELRAALLLPAGHGPDDGPLPVLLDPYGGPHAQRVLRAADAYLTSQWFADQGFAVLIADGRGTPARGPGWERAVAGDLATAPLQDQVDALHAAAEATGLLDLGRVAIRGWSFGGYLAALAVLRRPDVFHAAIAGAPVTDWSLYDTHYTERYLGTPQDQPDQYRRSSLLDDAANLSRPLLLIHGLADDNVVAAHTLRLSAALLAAGRPHDVLPLSGVTHMTPQEVVAENLLLLQLDFLRRSLPAS
jgi:dipeptidyl-peptidase-4